MTVTIGIHEIAQCLSDDAKAILDNALDLIKAQQAQVKDIRENVYRLGHDSPETQTAVDAIDAGFEAANETRNKLANLFADHRTTGFYLITPIRGLTSVQEAKGRFEDVKHVIARGDNPWLGGGDNTVGGLLDSLHSTSDSLRACRQFLGALAGSYEGF